MAVLICFEEFELDIEKYELRRSGRAVKLERIPMELLILLLQSEGKLVRREEIHQKLWGKAFQDTSPSVNTAVNKLRYIFRDDPRHPRFIQTVVGQGYRFIARVSTAPVPALASPTLASQGLAHSLPAVTTQQPAEDLRPFRLTQHAMVDIAEESAGKADETQERPTEASGVALGGAPPKYTLAPFRPPDGLQQPLNQPDSHSRRRGRVAVIWGVMAACLVLAAVVFLRWYQKRPHPAAATVEYHSIAVLPFVNLAQSHDQDYLVDGMTDQLITDLAGSTPLRVISRSSVMHFKGQRASAHEAAQTLQVDAVLEGSIIHHGDAVRITANLIDARNDRHLWAQVYAESGSDLLALQEAVTSDIVRQVALALGAQIAPARLRPVNVNARDAYMRGRFLWNQRTLASLEKSISYFQDAIKADPAYAEAYAAMGDAYVLLSSYGGPDPAVPLEKAQEAAEHALQLGGGMAEAHTILGAVKTDRDWDWSGAETDYRRAIELNPSYPTARHWLSLHLARMGRTQEADAEIQRARALDPFSPIISTDAGEIAYFARRQDDAMSRVDHVLALDPYFAEAHQIRGKIYEQQHLYEKALAEFRITQAFSGSVSNVRALQAHALALAGASEQATEMVKQLELDSIHSYVSGVDIALVYCALHQPGPAMAWLEKGFQNHDKGMNMLGVEPLFDGCRSDARFQALLQKLRLQPAA